jgi:hypothetical protein
MNSSGVTSPRDIAVESSCFFASIDAIRSDEMWVIA